MLVVSCSEWVCASAPAGVSLFELVATCDITMSRAALPHVEWLDVLHGSARDVLRHRGSGELVPLSTRCRLHFEGESGDGILRSAHDDGESFCEWAQNLLSTSVHSDEVGGIYISTGSGEVQWRSDLFEKLSAARVCRLHCAMGDFVTEVFISTSPRGMASVRWSVPYLLNWLFGPIFNSSWFAQRSKRFEQYIVGFGFVHSDWSPSRSAVACRARNDGGGQCSPSSMVEFDQDFSISSRGMIALLL